MKAINTKTILFIVILITFIDPSKGFKPFVYENNYYGKERSRRLEKNEHLKELQRERIIEQQAKGVIEDWNHMEYPKSNFPEEIITYENLQKFRSKAFLRESGSFVESYTVQHRLYMYSRGIPAKTVKEINFGVPINERQENIINLLQIASQWMKSNNLTFWLTHGTLIGSQRHKGIVPWDLDADLAIDYDTYTGINRLVGKHSNSKPEEIFLSKDVQLIIRKGETAHVIPFKLCNTTNGVYIDLFLFWNKDNTYVFTWPYGCKSCKHHPNEWYEVKKDMVHPLQQCEFEGKLYPCPSKPKEYLNLWYDSLSPPHPEVRLYLRSLRRIDWDGDSPNQIRQKRLKETYESFPESRGWKY